MSTNENTASSITMASLLETMRKLGPPAPKRTVVQYGDKMYFITQPESIIGKPLLSFDPPASNGLEFRIWGSSGIPGIRVSDPYTPPTLTDVQRTEQEAKAEQARQEMAAAESKAARQAAKKAGRVRRVTDI